MVKELLTIHFEYIILGVFSLWYGSAFNVVLGSNVKSTIKTKPTATGLLGLCVYPVIILYVHDN